MTRMPAALALGLALAAPAAAAADRVPGRDRFLVRAPVVEARPVHVDAIVREPRLECAPGDRHAHRRERTATVAGALLGGAIGNGLARDGSRAGWAAATVAGSLVGASAGRRLVSPEGARGHDPHRYAPHRYGAHRYGAPWSARAGRCVRTVETRRERRLSHYEVVYTLRGRQLRARRATDPGDTIEIDVSLAPSRR